jgi:large subunit ribosomal protein L25
MDKTIAVTVPVLLKGEAKGVKQQGGNVDYVHREIEIEVLPGDIPENITVDISELMLHEGIRVRDLQTEGSKWTATSEPDMMIVHVVPPRAEEVVAVADVAAVGAVAAAEPEVIKKGKLEKPEEAEKTEKK